MIPNLLSQSVPNISSISTDDLKRSKSDGPDSAAATTGVRVEAGGEGGELGGADKELGGFGTWGPAAAGATRETSAAFPVTRASAAACEGVADDTSVATASLGAGAVTSSCGTWGLCPVRWLRNSFSSPSSV